LSSVITTTGAKHTSGSSSYSIAAWFVRSWMTLQQLDDNVAFVVEIGVLDAAGNIESLAGLVGRALWTKARVGAAVAALEPRR
jgi:divalent metal cation (Fe/Co/Zn/Cd) transporter